MIPPDPTELGSHEPEVVKAREVALVVDEERTDACTNSHSNETRNPWNYGKPQRGTTCN